MRPTHLFAIVVLANSFNAAMAEEPILPQIGDAALARAIGHEFGVELLAHLTPNACHGSPLEPCLADPASNEQPFLTLGGIVASPSSSIVAGGIPVWDVLPSNYCPVPQDEAPSPREPTAGLEEWDSGPLVAAPGGLVARLLGLPPDYVIDSFSVTISNTFIYSLSSRGRADLLARTLKACHHSASQPMAVVGLASGYLQFSITSSSELPDASPSNLFELKPSSNPRSLFLQSKAPLFFGIVLAPVDPVHQPSD